MVRLNRKKSNLPKSALHSRLMKYKSDDHYNNEKHGGPCYCFMISKLGKNKGFFFLSFMVQMMVLSYQVGNCLLVLSNQGNYSCCPAIYSLWCNSYPYFPFIFREGKKVNFLISIILCQSA